MTTIELSLLETTNVQLELYDFYGRKVSTLVAKQEMLAGHYRFNWECGNVESGMYFLTLNGVQVDKLVVLR
jgi:hypothetical protein